MKSTPTGSRFGQENQPVKFSDNGDSLRDLVGVIGPQAAKDRPIPSHSIRMSKLLADLPPHYAAKPALTDLPKEQKPPVLSAPDDDHPWGFPLALLFIISIVAMGAFQAYRKSSKPRRTLAARISA